MTATAMNIGRLLSDTARRLPSEPGLIRGGESWSWRQLDQRADKLAALLRELGCGAGSAVLVMAHNGPELFDSMWACFKLGAVWTPCNTRLAPPEAAYMAGASKARVMISDVGFADHRATVSEATEVVHLVVGGAEGESYQARLAEVQGAPAGEAEVARDDPCWLFYTSGTTGRPKGALLTHGQLAFVVNNHLADLMPGLNWARDASLAVAPLSHGAGAHLLSQVARGVRTVLTTGLGLDEAEVWRLVEEHRISNLFTVPLILTRLVRHPAVDHYDHGSLAHVIYAGAPMYRRDQRLALEKLGKVIVQYYGLGEVTGNITVLPREEHDIDDDTMRVGSCGLPRTGMEIAILDEDGRRLPAKAQGEVCVRGPAVFAGYLDNPEANAAALKDGWFHTGDLGYLDASGYLYLTGRASDMYISGGANVYPREIEEVLLTHPAVAEVAVLGLPDPDWGEVGVAVVVPTDGPPANPEALARDLCQHLDGKLAKFKWPKRTFFWESLPASGYGKIPKHVVRRQLFERGDVKEPEA